MAGGAEITCFLLLLDNLSALSEQGCTFLSDNDLKSLEYNLSRYNILIVSTCNESLEHILVAVIILQS